MSEDNYGPFYANLYFDLTDSDGGQRFKECTEARNVLAAVDSYARWLREKVKDDDAFSDYLDAWNVLFRCFDDFDVLIPGWE